MRGVQQGPNSLLYLVTDEQESGVSRIEPPN